MEIKSVYVQYYNDLDELAKKHFELDTFTYVEAQNFHETYKCLFNQFLLYKYYNFKKIDSGIKIDNLFMVAYLVNFKV